MHHKKGPYTGITKEKVVLLIGVLIVLIALVYILGGNIRSIGQETVQNIGFHEAYDNESDPAKLFKLECLAKHESLTKNSGKPYENREDYAKESNLIFYSATYYTTNNLDLNMGVFSNIDIPIRIINDAMDNGVEWDTYTRTAGENTYYFAFSTSKGHERCDLPSFVIYPVILDALAPVYID